MKRAPYKLGEDLSGQTQWKSLAQLEGSPEFQESAEREFPADASVLDPVSRRNFLKLAGASAGLAGMAACRRPEEKIVPYVRQPEHLVPGKAEHYATAIELGGTVFGLLVESHEGRPTKIEGNPVHPDSLGASNAFLQATVLDLYDVDRSQGPMQGGKPSTLAAVEQVLLQKGASLKAENGGSKLAILTTGHRSPTTAGLLAEVKAAMPNARIHRYEPVSRMNVRNGTRAAFGAAMEPVHFTREARLLVSLDSDFLNSEYSSVRNARGFARGRQVEKPGDTMNRFYAVESRFSVTGANADHRLRMRAGEVTEFAYALAAELVATHGVNLGEAGAALASFKTDKFDSPRPFLKAVARELAQNKGAGLVVAGYNQPAGVHAVVALINAALENVGKTVQYHKVFDDSADDASSLAALVDAIGKNEVDTLVILGGNPAFTAPGDVDFAGALKRVPTSIHLGYHVDETSTAASIHLNRAHELETWGDLRAEDGTLSVVQPLIAPLYQGRTDDEVLSLLLGAPRKAYDLVRASWQKTLGATEFDKAWRKALHDGMAPGTTAAGESVTPTFAEAAKAITASAPHKAEGIELTFQSDSHVFDGRFNNNGWMQEMPDPMSKITWDNAAVMSLATATKLGAAEGDLVSVSTGGAAKLELPVVIVPGHPDDTIMVTLGYGRTVVGFVGKGHGFNTYALRSMQSPWVAGAQVSKTGKQHQLARTQEHHNMEGRPLVRQTDTEGFAADPEFAKKMVKHPPLLSLFPDREYNGHKWGMVIDLNACIGCSACMVACQAENNIPVVGKWAVVTSREMHWIRVDRYFDGKDAHNPRAVFQPLPCMHCELAPCEQVCPVAATTHSPEGLNDMAYNRCVGTRYCANNCPYKVRRFNFHNYSKDWKVVSKQQEFGHFVKPDYPELRRMQFNPDVTVRERGVIEKCSYCVQRINGAKIAAKREGNRALKDGEIIPACQQSCPAGAIHFGDLNLSGSDVAVHAANPRNYGLLTELNTRPRTTYLARVRNINRELEA